MDLKKPPTSVLTSPPPQPALYFQPAASHSTAHGIPNHRGPPIQPTLLAPTLPIGHYCSHFSRGDLLKGAEKLKLSPTLW